MDVGQKNQVAPWKRKHPWKLRHYPEQPLDQCLKSQFFAFQLSPLIHVDFKRNKEEKKNHTGINSFAER